jgi:hypothetical protein
MPSPSSRLPCGNLILVLACSVLTFPQTEKNKIICDHAAPPLGMHYVCKSQCDCHLEGKLKNDEDGIAAAPKAVPQDAKITTVTTSDMNGHVFHETHTLYVHGERTRRDFHADLPDGSTNDQSFIDLCDAHKAIELDPKDREYHVDELGEDGLGKGWQKHMEHTGDHAPKRGGTVEIVTENTDMHESKNILGHVAHHWLTTQKMIPAEGACATSNISETDGWYIDLAAPAGSCRARVMQKEMPRRATVHSVLTTTQKECADRYKFTGEQVDHGMPLLLTHVTHFPSHMPDGKEVQNSGRTTMEVTELSTAPVDPKTFDVPVGYKKVARLRTSAPPRTLSDRFDLWWEELKNALGD